MGIERTASSSPNKLTKYQETVEGNSFYTSEVQPETNQYSGTIVHFWFRKLVLCMLHTLKCNFKNYFFSILTNFCGNAVYYHRSYTEYQLSHHTKSNKKCKVKNLN